MKPLFCFIDDADFELENFRQYAVPAFAGVDLVYAKTFAEAQQALAGRLPLCFLLDLYGTDPRVIATELPDRAELAAFLGGSPPTIEAAYQGLQGGGSELGNQFLRQLYAQVDRWQQTFLFAAGLLGQGLGYGLANFEAVRAAFPWAAAVGYTRKSLFADAVRASLAEMDGLLQKPQGRGDDEIAEATKAAGPALAKAAWRAVDRRLAQRILPMALKLAREGAHGALVTTLTEGLKHLGVKALGAATRPVQETVRALDKSRLERSGLDRQGMDTLLAMAEWLEHR